MSRETRTSARIAAASALWLGAATALAQPAASFTSDLEIASDQGHTTLQWQSDAAGSLEYQLEHASADGSGGAFGSGELWYQGPAERSFVSGLEEGVHLYRVRAREMGEAAGPWGPWSSPVEITVAYQSMKLAWTLFSVGAVMFLSIVAFVVWQSTGSRAAAHRAEGRRLAAEPGAADA